MSKLCVYAGPNGSGKSVITSKQLTCGQYVNADIIKAKLHCSDMEAAIIAEKTREYFLERQEDFTFETVLSTPRNIDLMRRAKQKGYCVECNYVLTADPKINVERVHQRVAEGRDDIPAEKVIARYIRALKLLPQIFDICDEIRVIDNSLQEGTGKARVILYVKNGNFILYPNEIWSEDMLQSLISGTYPDEYISQRKSQNLCGTLRYEVCHSFIFAIRNKRHIPRCLHKRHNVLQGTTCVSFRKNKE